MIPVWKVEKLKLQMGMKFVVVVDIHMVWSRKGKQ